MNPVEAEIAAGLGELDVDAPAAVPKLAGFVSGLQRWNRVYNLTAVQSTREMVALHLLDSIAVLPWIRGSELLDVGSGAGLPGIPLAIVRPQLQIVLLDSQAKRTRFMIQMKADLQLANVEVVHRRVEQYQPDGLFDTVISRAFASLAEFIAVAGRLCKTDGCLLALKGLYPRDELGGLPDGWQPSEVKSLEVPGVNGKRHLVRLERIVAAKS